MMTNANSLRRTGVALAMLVVSLTWRPGNEVSAQVITESFDNTTFPPAGWLITGGANSRWERVTSGTNPTCSPHSGSGMARFFGGFPGGSQELMTSPVIDWSGASGSMPAFSLWIYRDGGSTAGDSLSVFVNTSGTLSGATHIGAVARSRFFVLPTNEPSDGWYQYTFNIPVTFNTDTNYILLRGTAWNGGNIHIDDVQWDEFTTPCTGTPVAGGVGASDSLICDGGGSTNLFLTGSGSSGGGVSYQWQSAPDSVGPWTGFGPGTSTVNTGTIMMTTWFRCYLECTNGGMADTSSALEVLVNPNPDPVVNVTPGPTINYCTGEPPILVFASGAASYVWSPNISISANGDTAIVGPASTVTYSVTGIDTFGCTGSTSLTVNVSNSPNVTASASQDTICSGEQVNLSGNVPGPGFGVTWLWLPDSLSGASQTVSPTMTTTYVAGATSIFSGCTGYDSVEVFVYPSPVAGFSYTVNGITITFTDTSAAGIVSWSWNFGDGISDTVQHPVHTYQTGGTYTVTLTVSNGNCTDTFSQTIMVVGIGSPLVSVPVSAYPNPAGDWLDIEFRHTGGTVVLSVFDIQGRQLWSSQKDYMPGVVQRRLDLKEVAGGMYCLRIRSAKSAASVLFVKE